MRTNRRELAYEAIDGERNYQDERWKGTASGDNPGKGALDRSIDEYALYIQGYAAELTQVASHSGNKHSKLEIVRKIAALAVACMEQHGAQFRSDIDYITVKWKLSEGADEEKIKKQKLLLDDAIIIYHLTRLQTNRTGD